MELFYPRLHTIAYTNSLFRLYNQAKARDCSKLIFDLTSTEFITPMGIILLAGTISECLQSGMRVGYRSPKKIGTRKFLAGIGFNDFFNLQDLNHKIESPNVQLRRLDSIDYLLTDQIIYVFGNSINMTDGVKGSLKLALNELMSNAFDHSESKRGCYVCAQSYPQAKSIRLCIADFGIGILRALRKSPSFGYLQADADGIILAVQEGVTSREGMGYAGYGLSHINRFEKVNQGRLCIISGNGKVVWDYKNQKYRPLRQTMHFPFDGTIINLEINSDKKGLYFLKSEESSLF